MAETSACKHEGCSCEVPKERAATGDAYCSDYCAKHSGSPGHAAHDCSCGHPNCGK
ncbi:MAG: metallothionein [Polyangiaceae bacterium]